VESARQVSDPPTPLLLQFVGATSETGERRRKQVERAAALVPEGQRARILGPRHGPEPLRGAARIHLRSRQNHDLLALRVGQQLDVVRAYPATAPRTLSIALSRSTLVLLTLGLFARPLAAAKREAVDVPMPAVTLQATLRRGAEASPSRTRMVAAAASPAAGDGAQAFAGSG
jgi:hypothetical protein